MTAQTASLTSCTGERQTHCTSKKNDRRAMTHEHHIDCPDGCADELCRQAPNSEKKQNRLKDGRPASTRVTVDGCADELRRRPSPSTRMTAPMAALTSCAGERQTQTTTKKQRRATAR